MNILSSSTTAESKSGQTVSLATPTKDSFLYAILSLYLDHRGQVFFLWVK